MRQALGRVNLKAQSCEKIIVRLVKAVTCPAYLSCKEGRQFIAFTLTLDTKLVKVSRSSSALTWTYHCRHQSFQPLFKSYSETRKTVWLDIDCRVTKPEE